ncbi:hypothetical protein CA235_13335 [Sphingomonas sp. ABOLF]|nr:hypothetical protein CA235_13335 [Sphingomonas sp. ABOLF]
MRSPPAPQRQERALPARRATCPSQARLPTQRPETGKAAPAQLARCGFMPGGGASIVRSSTSTRGRPVGWGMRDPSFVARREVMV